MDRTKLWGLSPLGILVDAGYTTIDIWWPVKRSFVPLFIALWICGTYCEEPPPTREKSSLTWQEILSLLIIHGFHLTSDDPRFTYICMVGPISLP